MPSTYEPIATTTLGSAASSITFNSIPATYTDLVIQGTQLGNYISLRFNNTTGSSTAYSRTTLGADTSVKSQRATSTSEIEISTYSGYTDTTNPKVFRINVFDYAGSTNKTTLSECGLDSNGVNSGLDRTVGLYRSTTAITRIDLVSGTNGFAIGTIVTLYGIKNA